ncbi:MAG: winged helix-turn-helix transcriptional regulator [Alphaproteobacteria bacterium]|nr:winged helix-turn-helix transcriptional regulator [Alphaproteobacteria bacterium]
MRHYVRAVNAVSETSRLGLSEVDAVESPTEAGITVSLLTAVEESSLITQRSLSRRLGIALGLTNAYLRRCINKGFIKIAHAPANRYRYYLTPKGFAEKGRLTANYLAYSFDFLRRARADYEALFLLCEERGWRRIALCGAGELADIARLSADGRDLTLVGLVTTADAEDEGRLRAVLDLGALDAIILTDYRSPQRTFDALIRKIPEASVLAPRLLNVSRKPPRFAD